MRNGHLDIDAMPEAARDIYYLFGPLLLFDLGASQFVGGPSGLAFNVRRIKGLSRIRITLLGGFYRLDLMWIKNRHSPIERRTFHGITPSAIPGILDRVLDGRLTVTCV